MHTWRNLNGDWLHRRKLQLLPLLKTSANLERATLLHQQKWLRLTINERCLRVLLNLDKGLKWTQNLDRSLNWSQNLDRS